MFKIMSAAAIVSSIVVLPAMAATRPTHPPVKPLFNPPSHVLPVKIGSDRTINPQPLPPKVSPRQ